MFLGWVDLFWTKECDYFFQILKGRGVEFCVHTSLANIFSKCHKIVFIKKNPIEVGHIKYELWGGFFLIAKAGVFCVFVKGQLNFDSAPHKGLKDN